MRPTAVVGLRVGQVLQAAVVHFADVAGDQLAGAILRQLAVQVALAGQQANRRRHERDRGSPRSRRQLDI
jgi:hypothetical protein